MPWSPDLTRLPFIKSVLALASKLGDWLARLVGIARLHELELQLPYSATVRPLGSRSVSQLIEVTDNTAFTVANPANPSEGAIITLDFLNSAGGSIGTVTFGNAYVLDGTFIKPGVGQRIGYRFVCSLDGKWREVARSQRASTLPTAGFTVSKSHLVVTVTDTSHDVAPGTITAWDYDWGDSTAHATVQNPAAHTYGAAGTYTITQTVTDNDGNHATFALSVTVTAVGGTTLGVPQGPFDLFLDTDTLRPVHSMFNASLDNITAGNMVARLQAADTLGIGVILAMTGGARINYLTNSVFDRVKWSNRQQDFNTSAIKAQMAIAQANLPLCVASVMDEPGNDGGPGNESNSWGPTGTMSKAGATPQQLWGLTLASNAAVSAGATTITIASPGLDTALKAGTLLTFTPGHGKSVVLAQDEAKGTTVLHVTSVPVAMATGNVSYSNAVDNMCQEVKNIFGESFAVGCFLDYTVFPSQSFAIADFIISQYRWNKTKGDVDKYITGALALGDRDGHKIAFANNVLDGGIPVGAASGCSQAGYWVCGSNTGGLGSYCPNCAQTPTQVEAFGKKLGGSGVFLTYWKYRDAFFNDADNQAAFQAVADYLAIQPRPDPHR